MREYDLEFQKCKRCGDELYIKHLGEVDGATIVTFECFSCGYIDKEVRYTIYGA